MSTHPDPARGMQDLQPLPAATRSTDGVHDRGHPAAGDRPLQLVAAPADSAAHCAWLRSTAEDLLAAEPHVNLDGVARQLQDYAAVLEHAERYGWWNR